MASGEEAQAGGGDMKPGDLIRCDFDVVPIWDHCPLVGYFASAIAWLDTGDCALVIHKSAEDKGYVLVLAAGTLGYLSVLNSHVDGESPWET